MFRRIDYGQIQYDLWPITLHCIIYRCSESQKQEFIQFRQGPGIVDEKIRVIYTTLVANKTIDVEKLNNYQIFMNNLTSGYIRFELSKNFDTNHELVYALSKVILPFIKPPLFHYIISVTDEEGFKLIEDMDESSESWTHESYK